MKITKTINVIRVYEQDEIDKMTNDEKYFYYCERELYEVLLAYGFVDDEDLDRVINKYKYLLRREED